METRSQSIERLRFAFAIAAALSILLGSIIASNHDAHAALHACAGEVPHDHHSGDSDSDSHHEDEEQDGHSGCFICEISSGQLVIETCPSSLALNDLDRANSFAPEFSGTLQEIDLRLPPILGPPVV